MTDRDAVVVLVRWIRLRAPEAAATLPGAGTWHRPERRPDATGVHRSDSPGQCTVPVGSAQGKHCLDEPVGEKRPTSALRAEAGRVSRFVPLPLDDTTLARYLRSRGGQRNEAQRPCEPRSLARVLRCHRAWGSRPHLRQRVHGGDGGWRRRRRRLALVDTSLAIGDGGAGRSQLRRGPEVPADRCVEPLIQEAPGRQVGTGRRHAGVGQALRAGDGGVSGCAEGRALAEGGAGLRACVTRENHP